MGVPGNYAHYRFGVQAINQMPPDVRRTVKRFRRLYDMGLHGPDLFFYYNPLITNPIGKLGRKFHFQTGREFFSRCVRMLRLYPSEAGRAYLYGLLTHYTLDSLCHPYIRELHDRGIVDHSALESEFDRYLLELDGRDPEYAQEMRRHMRLTPGECQTVAQFYPGTKDSHIQKCVKNMAFYTALLTQSAGPRRTILEKGMAVVAPGKLGMLSRLEPDKSCGPYVPALFTRCSDAADRFPALLQQLLAHLGHGEALGSDFDEIFG